MMNKRILLAISTWIHVFICVMVLAGCSRDQDMTAFFKESGPMETENGVGDLYASVEENAETKETEIVVYLCGAIKNPGVYTLKAGSRICDAVEAAGGFTKEANVSSVNLAAKMEDADMVYIPAKEEMVQDADGTSHVNTLININTADKSTLCRLPGIGESKAGDIITYREKYGMFQKKEDIMKVTGIKESLYEQICDLICVR